jgi:DNA-binding transcriptional LysR family regulator
LFQLGYLRYFHAVSRTQSIRRAAEELNVAQSAVSRQISNLELALGMSLFDRHSRGVRLTEAGEILSRYARQTMLDLERVRSEIDDLRALRRGTVNLCTVEAGIIDIVPRVVGDFQRRYPAVRVSVVVRGTQGVIETVLNDDADLGLAFNAPEHPDIAVAGAEEQRLYAAAAPSHRLAALRQVRIADLEEERIALPDTSFGIRQLVDRMERRAGTRLNAVLQTNSIQLLVSFARLGQGVAFLPLFAIKGEIAAGRIAAAPVADPLARKATVEVVVHRGRQLPLAAEQLMSDMRAALGLLQA